MHQVLGGSFGDHRRPSDPLELNASTGNQASARAMNALNYEPPFPDPIFLKIYCICNYTHVCVCVMCRCPLRLKMVLFSLKIKL